MNKKTIITFIICIFILNSCTKISYPMVYKEARYEEPSRDTIWWNDEEPFDTLWYTGHEKSTWNYYITLSNGKEICVRRDDFEYAQVGDLFEVYPWW